MKVIFDKIREKGTNVCVGIDPHPDKLPEQCNSPEWFVRGVLEAVSPYVGVAKFQSAIFEAMGHDGVRILEAKMRLASHLGMATILDYKRGDIPDTVVYYAKQAFEVCHADAITVNPWMGESCVRKFVEIARKHGKGVFVVVRPTSWTDADEEFNASSVLDVVSRIGEENVVNGWADVGAVVGATADVKFMRNHSAKSIPFLVPGVGAQGGSMDRLRGIPGLVIPVSRAILFPDGEIGDWKSKVIVACRKIIQDGQNQKES